MCDDCRAKKDHDRWYSKPEVDWDGEWPIAEHNTDKYFFTDSDLLDYIEENYEDAESIDDVLNSLRLTSCHQCKPRTFDVNEWLCDDLPDDGEVNDAGSIDDRINAILSEIGTVSFMMNSDRLNVRQILTAIGYTNQHFERNQGDSE